MVVASGDAAKMLEAIEEALDEISCSIQMTIVMALHKSVGAGRNHRLRPRALDRCHQGVGVVALVGNQGGAAQALDQFLGTVDVGDLSGGQDKAQRVSDSIDRKMQLRAQPASRPAERLIAGFFWAPAAC